MPKKKNVLTDEEVLRIARASVTMTGAAAYTEIEIDTQLSIERGVIWMIHFIEFSFSALTLTEVGAAGNETIDMHVARESKAATVFINDAECIQHYREMMTRSAAIGTDTGPLYASYSIPKKFSYPVPFPYASQSIYFGVDASMAAAAVAQCRIGYSIRTVGDAYFFRVAQAILG